MITSDECVWRSAWISHPAVPCTQCSGIMTCIATLPPGLARRAPGRKMVSPTLTPGQALWKEQWLVGCVSRRITTRSNSRSSRLFITCDEGEVRAVGVGEVEGAEARR